MTRKRWNLRVMISVMAAIAVVAVACSSSDPTPTATATPDNLAVLPVYVPYVFSGNFTVAGEPGPKDTRMFARLGDGRGPFNDAIRTGEYLNVSVTAGDATDLGKEITFYIGDPSGPTVQAEETYTYTLKTLPEFVELDLTFPRLP